MCDNLTGVCTCGLAGHSHHHHEHDGGHAPFHRLFGELHETYESEFGSISPSTPDDDGTAAARKTANENPTAENLLALAGALCFQLRYKEAAEFYEKILAGAPSNYAANRKLALCMLKTRNFGKARELLAVCDRLNPASLDVIYRQGLCEFYDGNFERAEEYFINCYPLTRDNGDMYIAVIYWHLLTLVRLGKDTGAALAEYSSDIQIGHHVGYLLTCKLFAGEDTLAHLTESTEDAEEMTRTLLLYGVYHYEKMRGKRTAARAALSEMLDKQTYWGSFAWIAAYGDGKAQGLID